MSSDIQIDARWKILDNGVERDLTADDLTARQDVIAALLSPARAVAIPAASSAIAPGATSLRGVVLRETSGAFADVILRDGTASGAILAPIRLNPFESIREPLNVAVVSPAGVWVERVSGTVEGSVLVP